MLERKRWSLKIPGLKYDRDLRFGTYRLWRPHRTDRPYMALEEQSAFSIITRADEQGSICSSDTRRETMLATEDACQRQS